MSRARIIHQIDPQSSEIEPQSMNSTTKPQNFNTLSWGFNYITTKQSNTPIYSTIINKFTWQSYPNQYTLQNTPSFSI